MCSVATTKFSENLENEKVIGFYFVSHHNLDNLFWMLLEFKSDISIECFPTNNVPSYILL